MHRHVARVLHRWHRDRFSTWEPTPDALRQAAHLERVMGLIPSGNRRVQFDGFLGEWTGTPADRVILYFHGGGFVVSGVATERLLAARLASATGIPVLSVGYRQLPEAQVAASVADGVTAYRQLLAHGHAPERIVIAGMSAGGYMAFATAYQAAVQGLPKPAALVGQTPWLDLDCAETLAHANARLDALMPAQVLDSISKALGEPPFNPKTDDLSKLPPAYIQVGSLDVMRHMAERMAERMPHCTLDVWEGHFHGSLLIPGTRDSRVALRRIGVYVERATRNPRSSMRRVG
ncbi:alpha/beta hydrolase fold domain-containing protein [Actinomadura barringtoniae]|uniref:Alpha/beta hydrolase fold domain-containing protein n=1 Tax=Actinomadura barringtoniae TaxID=1427535 RepID=A0A939P8Y6_9ACTN|nr:alpha/beta hydrolase fold domain-containing protein [Actinomadura barringtoniae]MBO2445473.1 alpha/beta hydrolase fold domain-containing protein [Actinomadura barringtoniae]